MKKIFVLCFILMGINTTVLALDVELGDPPAVCANMTLVISPSITGGSGSYTILWKANGIPQPQWNNQVSISVVPSQSTLYEVEVRDQESNYACSDDIFIFIWEPETILYKGINNFENLTETTELTSCRNYTFKISNENSGAVLNWHVYDINDILGIQSTLLAGGQSDEFTYKFGTDLGYIRICFWCDANGNSAFDATEKNTYVDVYLVDATDNNDAVFLENANAQYGFDAWTQSPSSISLSEPNPNSAPLVKDGRVWLSVEEGKNTTVWLHSSTDLLGYEIALQNDLGGTALNANSVVAPEQIIQITAPTDVSEPFYDKTDIALIGCDDNTPLTYANLAVYPIRETQLKIVNVNGALNIATGFNEAALQTFLDETFYQQGIVKWDIMGDIQNCTSTYDGALGQNPNINISAALEQPNGKLDFVTFPNEYYDEPDKIIQNCQANDPNTYYVFFVEKTQSYNGGDQTTPLCGRIIDNSLQYTRFAFVATEAGCNVPTKTAAHELGHCLLLKHPGTDTNDNEENYEDPENLMYIDIQGKPGNQLRKFQWDRMHINQ